MTDEKLSLTEGNGEFAKKEAFVLGMGKDKDFDRRVRLAEKNEMRKRIKSRKYFAFCWTIRSLMFLEFCLVGGMKCKKRSLAQIMVALKCDYMKFTFC